MNSPAEVANNYVNIGKGKVNLPIAKMFILAILAGMFIAMAGVGASTASASITTPSVAKFVSAIVFPGGLAMVLLAGSELFTGNNLIIIPLLEKQVTIGGMLKNWVIVWLGNLVGSVLISAICVYGNQVGLYSGALAVADISTAISKCSMSFGQAFLKGIGCNFLVCIAVWISFAAKDVAGKVIGLFFPIMLFVVSGFEHSVANMYYISVGLLANGVDSFAALAADAGLNTANLTWANMFIKNLLPVTLGNIVGGAVLVGLPYWFVYVRKANK
jgi:formate/nitrite transporter